MVNINLSITALVVVLVVAAAITFWWMYKWECKEGVCERKFNGSFSTQADCTKACGTKVSIPESPTPPASQTYDCSVLGFNRYGCQPSPDNTGTYTSWEKCQENCPPASQTVYTSVPVYTYPAWRRWGWRGPWRRW